MHPILTAWLLYVRLAELPYYYGTREYRWKIMASKNAKAEYERLVALPISVR